MSTDTIFFIDLYNSNTTFYCRREREINISFCLRPGDIKKDSHPASAPETRLNIFFFALDRRRRDVFI